MGCLFVGGDIFFCFFRAKYGTYLKNKFINIVFKMYLLFIFVWIYNVLAA